MNHLAEANLLALFESTDDLIWSADLDYRLVTFNRAFQRAFEAGYNITPRQGLLLSDLLPPERARQIAPLCRRAIAQGAFRTEYKMRNGCILEVSLYPIYVGGKITGVSFFGKDITERTVTQHLLAKAEQDLHSSETRYRTIFQNSLDGISISRLDTQHFVEVNQRYLDIIGYTHKEIVGKTSAEIGFWVDPEERASMVEALRRNGQFKDKEARLRRKNGEIVWVRMSASVIEIENVSFIHAALCDISVPKVAAMQLTEMQQALRTTEKRYRAVFQTSLDPISITRLSDGTYIDVNPAFLKLLGYERDEVVGRTSLELGVWVDPADRKHLSELLHENAACQDLEFRLRKKSGESIWILLSCSTMEIEGDVCLLCVIRDLSHAKAAEDEIHTLAFYDPLTHLPNRRLLLDRVEQALAASVRDRSKKAMLYVDLDNFKTLNDTLGHEAGDVLLNAVAQRLLACTREVDTLARLGGDEFAIMLEDLSESAEDAADQAGHIAARIATADCAPYLIAGREYHIRSSIGISIFGSESKSAHEILQQAEIAMFQAKAAGRKTVRFFAPALQAAVNARAAIEEELREAVDKNQMELFYQPQVGAKGLVGVEALIRWNHPHRGLLGPEQFIPLAEETGLILPIGQWALEAACKQLSEWSTLPAAAHLKVAVNISARQFHQPEFVDQLLSALYRSGANPANLGLELTESMLLENIEDVIKKMSTLKARGLRFSLDDFGTGYSSLSYLKRLPLDQLKIDRAFVRDILSDVTSGAIAQTIVALSRAMGLSVIAEGVETQEQRAFLSGLGCHVFQGYLYSRPIRLDEFERVWLHRPAAESFIPASPLDRIQLRGSCS
jgi:diguanylate cyclase (GGDEF)-like protein/PAS domain S-box-containing protein